MFQIIFSIAVGVGAYVLTPVAISFYKEVIRPVPAMKDRKQHTICHFFPGSETGWASEHRKVHIKESTATDLETGVDFPIWFDHEKEVFYASPPDSTKILMKAIKHERSKEL
jgi:hypothetical protein